MKENEFIHLNEPNFIFYLCLFIIINRSNYSIEPSSSSTTYPLNVQEINKNASRPINAATQKGVPKPKLELGTLDLKL